MGLSHGHSEGPLVLDATLREGEQHAGVRLAAADKARIVELLERFGADVIEVGHPAASESDFEACRLAAAAARRVDVLMHARAVPAEVLRAAEAGAGWVGVWAGVNDFSLAAKFGGRSLDFVHGRIAEAVAAARGAGLRTRFTVEDASRTPWRRLVDVAEVALGAGADRISLADTVGTWTPTACGTLVKRLGQELGCPVEVHCHDDLGLALANTLAAVEAGAAVVDASMLGIGERAGITDLFQLTTALRIHYGQDRFELRLIPEMARAASRTTGITPSSHRPLVGRGAFTHASPYHARAVAQWPAAYEAFPPEIVGRRRTIATERPPVGPARLDGGLRVERPFPRRASELLYHRDGVGERWVLVDRRVDHRTSFYAMQRTVTAADTAQGEPPGHVDDHTHHCDSTLIFLGDAPDRTGLTCRVRFGDEEQETDSPATVHIPAGVAHSYRIVAGAGTILNIVLAPDYNLSLEEPQAAGPEPADAAPDPGPVPAAAAVP